MDGDAAGDGPAPGEVWLVGAGPGDPGLITVRGRDLLARADVVVTDRLASAGVLDWARPDALVVHVGKSPGQVTVTQDGVNALLVEHVRAGRAVVRLKGGDPFVLGRGGEEAAACAAAGVTCTVVPGITSAFAAPAAAGIPVTHRGLAQDVAVVSGHLTPGDPASTVDWAALGASSATVVVLMGIGRLAAIADALIKGGRAAGTPAAVIERATTPAQRVLRSTLKNLGRDAHDAGVRSPAVVVVGEVAARSDGIPAVHGTGTERGPLAGMRVLVPRTRDRPGLLARRLRTFGADVVETVVSRPGPPDDPGPLLTALAGADTLVLADADEVVSVVTLLRRAGQDVRALAGIDLVAETDEALVALAGFGLAAARSDGASVAVCGSASPPAGTITVRRVDLLVDVRRPPDGRVMEELRHCDLHAVAFASSTAATATAALYGPLPAPLLVAAMGERTVAACRAAGIRVDAVAPEPGIWSLAATVADLLTARRS